MVGIIEHGPRQSSRAWVLCLALLPWGCEKEPTAPMSQASGTPFSLDILTVRDCAPPPHETLDAEERLVGVEVEVRAHAAGVPANFYYGRLKDAEGTSYEPAFSGCTPQLSGAPLRSGGSTRGFINFKVPARATGLALSYAPRLAGAGPAPTSSVELPLGR